MKDWQGNKIKVGDIVIIVTTKNIFSGGCVYLLDQSGDKLDEFEVEDEYLWIESKPIEVVENYTVIIFNKETGDVIKCGLFYLEQRIYDQSTDILCIKGISDNKEEYYTKYFENN